MNSPIVYPLLEDFLESFANEVFLPLKKHACLTCMFCAGGGKRTLFKLFLSDRSFIKKIFRDQYEKTLFVYVDPDEIIEMTNTAYLELLLNKLENQISSIRIEKTKQIFDNPLLKIKQLLKLLTVKGWDIIFLLNDFEFTLSLSPSIFLNLETIMAVNKSKITYLFLSTVNLLNRDTLNKMHNLKYAISQKVVYFPLLSEKNIMYNLKLFSRKYNVTLTDDITQLLINYCGGHPQLIKYSFSILKGHVHKSGINVKKAEESLSSNNQLKIICADIWNFLSDEEKSLITNVVLTKTLSLALDDSVQYLMKLGLIQKIQNNKYKVFGKIFEDFIKNRLPPQKLTFDPKTNKLYFGTQPCDDSFTHQEFKLLSYFLSHENEVISRDQVGEALWGRNYVEKFSDWSIDKIISNIRKKLDVLGYPSQNLTTLKKRGFSFINR